MGVESGVKSGPRMVEHPRACADAFLGDASMEHPTCSVSGCVTAGQLARGMCNLHYKRWQKWGDPLYSGPSVTDRFWAKVQLPAEPEGCWLWTGATIRGYGAFNVGKGKVVYAHRWSYEEANGPIPDGLTLDHLCRTPLCVKPTHLEPCPIGENVKRAHRAGYFGNANTCRRGHDWKASPPQIAHRSDGSVSRTCRVCSAERKAERPGKPKQCDICGTTFLSKEYRRSSPTCGSPSCRAERGRRAAQKRWDAR